MQQHSRYVPPGGTWEQVKSLVPRPVLLWFSRVFIEYESADTESSRRRARWHRANCRKLGIAIAAALGAWLLLAWVAALFAGWRFQPSRPAVFDAAARRWEPPVPTARDECRAFLASDHDECGVAAAQLRHYVAVAAMHVDGHVVEFFNPSFQVPDISADHTRNRIGVVYEKSPLCSRQRRVLRHRSVIAHFTNAKGQQTKMHLSGADSACFQLLVELVNGIYPCTPASADADDPRLDQAEAGSGKDAVAASAAGTANTDDPTPDAAASSFFSRSVRGLGE